MSEEKRRNESLSDKIDRLSLSHKSLEESLEKEMKSKEEYRTKLDVHVKQFDQQSKEFEERISKEITAKERITDEVEKHLRRIHELESSSKNSTPYTNENDKVERNESDLELDFDALGS